MTQEEKELLLQDLCTRLPYGVIMTNKVLTETYYPLDGNEYQQAYYDNNWDDVPYLRPMSSMTGDEWLKLKEWIFTASDTKGKIYFDGFRNISAEDTIKAIDYLISHHFDYRGLIEKGLAIEAPEGMYED